MYDQPLVYKFTNNVLPLRGCTPIISAKKGGGGPDPPPLLRRISLRWKMYGCNSQRSFWDLRFEIINLGQSIWKSTLHVIQIEIWWYWYKKTRVSSSIRLHKEPDFRVECSTLFHMLHNNVNFDNSYLRFESKNK